MEENEVPDFIEERDMFGMVIPKQNVPEILNDKNTDEIIKIGEDQIPRSKIYNSRAVYSGTFLGGPLVAGYMIAENYKIFGSPDKAKRALIISIIITLLILIGANLFPEIEKAPKYIIPVFYSVSAYVLVLYFQDSQIKKHFDSGGKFFSLWRSVGIGILSALITLGLFFSISYITGDFTLGSKKSKTYDAIHAKIEFDKSNISEAEVDQMVEGFKKIHFFSYTVEKSIYIKKVGSIYEISFGCDHTISTNDAALRGFESIRFDMQKVFPNNKIVLNLVVGSFDNIVKRIE